MCQGEDFAERHEFSIHHDWRPRKIILLPLDHESMQISYILWRLIKHYLRLNYVICPAYCFLSSNRQADLNNRLPAHAVVADISEREVKYSGKGTEIRHLNGQYHRYDVTCKYDPALERDMKITPQYSGRITSTIFPGRRLSGVIFTRYPSMISFITLLPDHNCQLTW